MGIRKGDPLREATGEEAEEGRLVPLPEVEEEEEEGEEAAGAVVGSKEK
jgi:hypothetical protein